MELADGHVPSHASPPARPAGGPAAPGQPEDRAGRAARQASRPALASRRRTNGGGDAHLPARSSASAPHRGPGRRPAADQFAPSRAPRDRRIAPMPSAAPGPGPVPPRVRPLRSGQGLPRATGLRRQGRGLWLRRGRDPRRRAPVIVELKLAFNLALVLQGVDRLVLTDRVYLAVQRPLRRRGAGGASVYRGEVRRLCRRLGLGLMAVAPGGRRGRGAPRSVAVPPAPQRGAARPFAGRARAPRRRPESRRRPRGPRS